MSTTTVDLAQEPSITAFYGRQALWASYDGTEYVGTVDADPMGSCWPVIRFTDGTYGRTGGVLALVDDDYQIRSENTVREVVKDALTVHFSAEVAITRENDR